MVGRDDGSGSEQEEWMEEAGEGGRNEMEWNLVNRKGRKYINIIRIVIMRKVIEELWKGRKNIRLSFNLKCLDQRTH